MNIPIATNAWTQEVPWIDGPEVDVDAFLRKHIRMASAGLREKLLFWKENGFVVFENAISSDLIDDFLNDIEQLKTNFHIYNISIEIQGKQTYSREVNCAQINDPGVKFNHLHTVSKAAARMSISKSISEFLHAIFQAQPVPTQSLTFWKGSQQAVHLDYPFVNRQKRLACLAASWIPLEAIHPDSGPLAYYPGAHRIGISGFFDWGNGNIIKGAEATRSSTEFASYLRTRIEEAGIEPVIFCPRKGDVLIWHGNLPHAGTPIKNPNITRKSYVTHYTSIVDYPDSWRLKPHELPTRSLQENGGVVFEFPWTSASDRLPSWAG
jgi:phytanoyl-CoA hydroxylase